MTTDTKVVAGSIRRRGRFYDLRRFSLTSLAYAALTIVGLISSIPLLWMLSTSLKESGNEFRFPPELIPYPVAWSNYIDVWGDTGIHKFFLNSVLITSLATIGTIITSSMVAFGFARITFPGRNALFVLMLSTMMLPGIVTLVPQFVLFRYMRWLDTPLPLIVPFWFGGGAFFIFLVRQFMLQLPKELDEAALADGASYLRIYWNIILPLTGPAVATVAIFSVQAHWNEFIAPLIFLNSETWRTLALALRSFLVDASDFAAIPPWNQLMASGIIMLVPILVLFFAAQRYFIRGIALSGLTGR